MRKRTLRVRFRLVEETFHPSLNNAHQPTGPKKSYKSSKAKKAKHKKGESRRGVWNHGLGS